MSTSDDGSYSPPPGGAGDQTEKIEPTYEEQELEEEEEPTEDGEET